MKIKTVNQRTTDEDSWDLKSLDSLMKKGRRIATEAANWLMTKADKTVFASVNERTGITIDLFIEDYVVYIPLSPALSTLDDPEEIDEAIAWLTTDLALLMLKQKELKEEKL